MNNTMDVGIGVDFKYLDVYNGAIKEVLQSAVSAVSHVSIVGVENVSDARALRRRFLNLPIIHHLSNVEPAGLAGLNRKRATALDIVSRILESPWCGEDIGVWSLNESPLPYFAGPPYTVEMANYVASNIKELQTISSVPFLAEVPSVGIVIGDITLSEFFARLSDQTGCGIVLDLSHIFSHAVALRQDWASILDGFPLDRVIEMHIAGGWVRGTDFPRYIDTHSHRVPEEVFALLHYAVPRAPVCSAITYEVGATLSEEDFVADLKRLDMSLRELKFQAGLPKR